MEQTINKIGAWPWLDLDRTTSTNDAVKSLCAELGGPCIVSARCQTAGRGRRGRQWVSCAENLFVSLAFEAALPEIGHLALLSGLAVAGTVLSFAPQAEARVKWPNDVLVAGKKISGILFEHGENGFWIMGVGINVAAAPCLEGQPYQACGLHDLGVAAGRLDVLRRFIAEFDRLLALYRTDGFADIRKSWLDKAWKLGKKITIKQEKQDREGIFQDIADDGSLLLLTTGGLERISAGDLFIKEEPNG